MRGDTYYGDGFDGDGEWVRSQIAGVGEGVFFPQLGGGGLLGLDLGAVSDVVA